ncbi:MAG: hypothetical protein AB1352_05295 [Patescibacteria group bacterium]
MKIPLIRIMGLGALISAGALIWFLHASQEPLRLLTDARAQFLARPDFHFALRATIPYTISSTSEEETPLILSLQMQGDEQRTKKRSSFTSTYSLATSEGTTRETGEIALKSVNATQYILFSHARGTHAPLKIFEEMGWMKFDAAQWYKSEVFNTLTRSISPADSSLTASVALPPAQSMYKALKALLLNPASYTLQDTPSWWHITRAASPLTYTFSVKKPELRQITSLILLILEQSLLVPLQSGDMTDYVNAVRGELVVNPHTKEVAQIRLHLEPLPAASYGPYSLGIIELQTTFAPLSPTSTIVAPVESMPFERAITILMNEWNAGSAFAPPAQQRIEDSDGDGLMDYVEFMEHKTDHLNPDTDGDGYDDGTEVQYGYDPLTPSLSYTKK